jgi:hypothetical protein
MPPFPTPPSATLQISVNFPSPLPPLPANPRTPSARLHAPNLCSTVHRPTARQYPQQLHPKFDIPRAHPGIHQRKTGEPYFRAGGAERAMRNSRLTPEAFGTSFWKKMPGQRTQQIHNPHGGWRRQTDAAFVLWQKYPARYVDSGRILRFAFRPDR